MCFTSPANYWSARVDECRSTFFHSYAKWQRADTFVHTIPTTFTARNWMALTLLPAVEKLYQSRFYFNAFSLHHNFSFVTFSQFFCCITTILSTAVWCDLYQLPSAMHVQELTTTRFKFCYFLYCSVSSTYCCGDCIRCVIKKVQVERTNHAREMDTYANCLLLNDT